MMENRDGHITARDEVALFDQIEQTLYTAVVSDALDECGHFHGAMRETLRPVSSKYCFAGRARTIQCMDIHYTAADSYGKEIEAVDNLLPGEVVVVATGGSWRNAPWGELLSTAAKARGARGAVVDGLVRDVKKIEDQGFPVFATGLKPVDSKGRGLVVDYDVPVDCGGVVVSPGDLIFADYDGVIVVPTELVDKVVRLAMDKVTNENHCREELKQGAYLRDVFEKYGIL